MDMIKDIFYLIYVIHQNAFISLYHFVITNVAFVILFMAILYVFNRQNVILERQTLRPMRRTMEHYPYGPQPAQFGGLADDIVMATLSHERLKLIGIYAAIIISVLVCFFFATKVVLYMITFMWVVGALSVKFMKGDREEMANKIQNYSLGYCLILITIKIMIGFVIGTPLSEWSRTLGVALPAAASGTLSGYLPMMFLILTFGFPLAYFRVVAQRWSIAHDNEDVVKRREEIMRTGNQNMLTNSQEEIFRNQNRLF